MGKQITDEIYERLAEAQAEIEKLQGAAADAEARSVTARAEAEDLATARDTALGELAQTREELAAARSKLQTAATRYRESRLATAPDLPTELVPTSESFDEIDMGFESALRLASQVREKMQEEQRSARVPAGSPTRRAQDMSTLSATEKIRLGIEERDRSSH